MHSVERMYMAYRQDLYRYLLGLTRDACTAEELLAQTFFQALAGIASFRGASSEKTWLFGIARNLWLRTLRARRHVPLEDAMLARYVSDGDMDGPVAARETLARVRTLLTEYGDTARDVVLARAEGYAYAQIAASLGVTESSARVIDFRTKKKLREALKEEGFL